MEILLNKLPKLTPKQREVIDFISRYSFYLGLFIELTIVILEKSEYIIQYEGLWFRFTFLLFGISLITTKHHLKEWIALFFFGLIGVISYKVTGRNEILRWIVFIWACQGKEMKKVLKFTFWYTLAGCIVIILLSITGIYGKVYLETIFRPEFYGDMGSVERRYCFGMGHPNSFHCMILVLTWLGLYCYNEKLKLYNYFFILILHFTVFCFTSSRTGLLMSLVTLALVISLKYWKYLQRKKLTYVIGILVIIACVSFSVFMAKYSITHPFFQKLDRYLTGRIFALMDSNEYDGMLRSWSLWSNETNDNYFDLGIVRMFYWYGIIPAGMYFLSQFRLLWCGYKRKDYMVVAILSCITIYSIFEAHFISDYIGRNYILFFFGMYLKDMLNIRKKE